jgi:hypothetical protein
VNIDAVINEAQKLLSENPEWVERYNGYVVSLLANLDFIKTARKHLTNSHHSISIFPLPTQRMQNRRYI